MLSSEKLLANVHELRYRVRSIANELLQLACDEARRLDLVEAYSARESALGEAPDGVEQELVLGVVSSLMLGDSLRSETRMGNGVWSEWERMVRMMSSVARALTCSRGRRFMVVGRCLWVCGLV